MTDAAARPPYIPLAQMTPEQRAAHDAIVAGPRGSVPGPLRVWLVNPPLAEAAQRLGAYCRYGSHLPPRLSELAILITGAFWRSGYEWVEHLPIALRAGIDPAVAEAIRTGATPVFASEDEAALHAFAQELLRTRRVSDATYARAVAALGREGVVDLVGILGYYTLISLTINAFEVPLQDGASEPFPEA
jgi:4-carboxymuconolactone decarboxylase